MKDPRELALPRNSLPVTIIEQDNTISPITDTKTVNAEDVQPTKPDNTSTYFSILASEIVVLIIQNFTFDIPELTTLIQQQIKNYLIF